LVINDIFAASEYPTMASGEISLMKGNSDAVAIVAAKAVFPKDNRKYRNQCFWHRGALI